MFDLQSFIVRDEIRKVPLSLCHRECAGWKRDTSHRVFAKHRKLSAVETVCPRDVFDLLTVIRSDPCDDNVLVCRHPEIAFVNLCDFKQAGLERPSREVQNASIFDEERQVMLTIFACNPPEAIPLLGKRNGDNRLERNS